MEGRVAGNWKRVEVEVEIESQPTKIARKKLVAVVDECGRCRGPVI